MKTINILDRVGVFAENKDIAEDIRLTEILPVLEKNKEITIDFSGVEGTTQSFIHALISDLFRIHGVDIIENIYFKNCNETVKKIIEIVVEYMQESE